MLDKEARIFLSGHRGMVGSAMHRLLLGMGYENIITRERKDLDLLDQQAAEEFLTESKPDCVIIAAAKVGGILANNKYRADFIYENIQLQNNLIHGSYMTGVKKLLFLGSSCIYPRKANQPIKEDYLLTDVLEQTNEPYAIAKIAGIKMCQAYNDQYGTDFVSVMPTNLYGPNDNFDLDTSHVLPALIRKFHLAKLVSDGNSQALDLELQTYTNKDIPASERDEYLSSHGIYNGYVELWGSGTPQREFMHVDDMAAASIHVLLHHSGNDIVNIGTGIDLPIRELAEKIRDIVGFDGEIRWNSEFPDGTPRKLLDVSRLKKLGWDQARLLENGLRETYQWYKANIKRSTSK
jgi:GDP-L-fucose synthase